MRESAPTGRATATSYEDLRTQVLEGRYGPDPREARVALAFSTRQAVRHEGRAGGYRNEVLSLRLGSFVGSCAVEPGQLPDDAIEDCLSADVATLLHHALLPVRVAALDAYLGWRRPHGPGVGGVPVPLPAGDSLVRSRARARSVVELLDGLAPGATVLVVGVVNSLLEALRERRLRYVAVDFKGGTTEWGEPVRTDALAEAERCDALLVSGMTLGNGTFEPLRKHAVAYGKPLVTFAQTGSAVLPCLLEAGVSAVSAEPYPFFWLDGGAGVIHQYVRAGGHGSRHEHEHGHESGHGHGHGPACERTAAPEGSAW